MMTHDGFVFRLVGGLKTAYLAVIDAFPAARRPRGVISMRAGLPGLAVAAPRGCTEQEGVPRHLVSLNMLRLSSRRT